MKELLKSGVIRALSAVRAFPTGLTDRRDLQALLKALSPLTTNRGLVRLGPRGDGGYLVPDDLVGIEACFSPGVSNVSGFEKDCAERGMRVFLADGSVDRPAVEHPSFRFTRKFVGAVSQGDFMTLDDWVASSLPADSHSDLLLQIDIEGFEYEAILAASEALLQRFRIIVAEFHHLDQLWSRPFFGLARRAFDRILRNHACVHIHPNNCCGALRLGGLTVPRIMEFSFLRKDRIERSSHETVFPHPLDCDNTPNPTLILPECWRGR